MPLSKISLNLLRAFDASARHLSFTKASKELFVTQAAVAHQVKSLEDYLQKPLFNRAARTLSLTDEGASLAPIVAKSLYEIGVVLETIRGKERKSVLHVGVVGTFALGFLLERMDSFHAKHPHILVKIQVNNNVPDLLNEHLDFAIRFGAGAWLAQSSELLMSAPLSPLCNAKTANHLKKPEDLANFALLRSHRKNEWAKWFEVCGKTDIDASGTIFDNSRAIADAAKLGLGVGLLPYNMFSAEIEDGLLIKPFSQEVHAGSYYLTNLVQRPVSEAMIAFRDWLKSQCTQF
ncbi:MAG: Transcriptional regulator [Hyphomonadaceae bacterium]|nr:MAG: Transcriptional regulator [Hyphomonadaceae bacterium]